MITTSGLDLGGFVIRWYSLILVGSGLIGIITAARLAPQFGQDREHAWRGAVWCLLFGILGARLWFVYFPPQSVISVGRTAGWQLTHFFDLNQGAIAVWMGGLGIFGGALGASAGLWLYCRRHKLPYLLWLDIGTVALALMQTLGRWGNAFNQDLYGPPTTLPWGILINDVTQRVGIYTDLVAYPLDATRFHPLFLYESLLTGIIFLVLFFSLLHRKPPRPPGDITLLYLLLYSPGRFLLESLRANPSLIAGINVSQVTMIVTCVGAILWYRQRYQRREKKAVQGT